MDSSGRTAKTVAEDERDFAAVMRDYVNSMAGSAMAPWDIRSPTRKIYEQDYKKRKKEEQTRLALLEKEEKAKKRLESKMVAQQTKGMLPTERVQYMSNLSAQKDYADAQAEKNSYLERKEKTAALKTKRRSNALYGEAEDPFAAISRVEADRWGGQGRGMLPGQDASYAAEFYRKKRQSLSSLNR